MLGFYGGPRWWVVMKDFRQLETVVVRYDRDDRDEQN